MRRLLCSLAALVACTVLLAACTSDNFYRGRAQGSGQAKVQAFRVIDGQEVPVTAEYGVNGEFQAQVQTVKPYLTLDGAWSPTVAGATEAEDGAVLIRPLPARGPQPGDVLRSWVVGPDGQPMPGSMREGPAPAASGDCVGTEAPPAMTDCDPPAVSAAPAPAAEPECRPVYRRVCGSDEYPTISGAPVTTPAWPCPGAPGPTLFGASPGDVGNAVVGVIAVPVGYLAHVGECAFDFLRCVVAPLIPSP